MKYSQIIVVLALGSILFSCKKNTEEETPEELNYYKVEDFTEAVFTNGIEGPAFKDGKLYAVNHETQGTIGIVESSGAVSTYATLPTGSIGNGIRFDVQGNMYIADYPKHNILKIPAGSTTVEVFANEDQMNQPNDVAIMKDGTLFASDPNWGESTGNLWMISNTGIVTLMEDSMGTTNGVEVSADEKYLYVNESVQRNIWRYEITPTKTLINKTLFKEFTDFGMDGMRCDVNGNLYVARFEKGVIAIFSPEGELLREVVLPGANPTNVAFGGPDFKTVYVTLQSEKRIVKFLNETSGRVSLFE